MTEIAAGRSSGRLLRRRYSGHNRRRMEKHRSLSTLAPMSQKHAWELLQKLAGRAGLLEGSGGHATIPPYMLRHSCTTLASTRGCGERECRTRSGTQAPRQPATTTPSAIVIAIPLNRLGRGACLRPKRVPGAGRYSRSQPK